jgi:hypothetical protein
MNLCQLLGSERRTKVRVALAHKLDRCRAQASWKLPVARLAALLRHQCCSAGDLVRPKQPANVAVAHAQHLRRVALRERASEHPIQHQHPVEL